MEVKHEAGRAFIKSVMDDDAHISHHGVKGMKWGIRKARDGKIKARSTMTRSDRKETDWVQSDQRLKSTRGIILSKGVNSYADAYNKSYRKAARSIRVGVRRINSNPKYKKQDFTKASALRSEYYKDISKMMTEQLNAAAATRKGASPSSKLEIHFDVDVTKSSQASVTVRNRSSAEDRKQTRMDAKESLKKLKHGDDDNSFDVELEFDDDGYILGVKEAEVKHSEEASSFISGVIEDNGTDTLAHYGVLGMKWGVRKDRGSRRTSTSDNDDSPKRKRSSAPKKSSSNSGARRFSDLSDDELKARILRLENEQKLARLLTPPPKKGREFVKKTLGSSGTQVLNKVLIAGGTVAAAHLARKLLEKKSPEVAEAVSSLINPGKKEVKK